MAPRTPASRDAGASKNESGVDIRAFTRCMRSETAAPTAEACSSTSASSSVLLAISSVRRIIASARSIALPPAHRLCARSA